MLEELRLMHDINRPGLNTLEVYAAIESPRGELGCFVLADGSAKPARVHMRDPSFVNLQSLSHMAEGRLIADLIAGIAMLDPILGGIDR